MQLHQIEALSGQIAQAVLDEAGKVLRVVAVGSVRLEPASGLCGDNDLFLPVAPELRDQALAVAAAIDVRGIDEIHAAIDGFVQRGQRLAVIDVTPRSADRPAAETDVRDIPSGTAQSTIVHTFTVTQAFLPVFPIDML